MSTEISQAGNLKIGLHENQAKRLCRAVIHTLMITSMDLKSSIEQSFILYRVESQNVIPAATIR